MTRLVYAVGILLLLGAAWSLRQPVPGIYGNATAPEPENDLWRLNFR